MNEPIVLKEGEIVKFAGYKLIPLSQGKFAKVDEEDYEFLSQWKWHYDKRRYDEKRGNQAIEVQAFRKGSGNLLGCYGASSLFRPWSERLIGSCVS